jgi:hypothetical protein
MTAYRCYFLGEDGKIKNAEFVESPTDAVALERAERRLASCGHPAIEVWDRDRHIGTVGHSRVLDEEREARQHRIVVASDPDAARQDPGPNDDIAILARDLGTRRGSGPRSSLDEGES